MIACVFGIQGTYLLHEFLANRLGAARYLLTITDVCLLCISGIACIAVTYSFWVFKKWGRYLAIVLAIYFMVSDVVQFAWPPMLPSSEVSSAIEAMREKYGGGQFPEETIRRLTSETFSGIRTSWYELAVRLFVAAAVIVFLFRRDVREHLRS